MHNIQHYMGVEGLRTPMPTLKEIQEIMQKHRQKNQEKQQEEQQKIVREGMSKLKQENRQRKNRKIT